MKWKRSCDPPVDQNRSGAAILELYERADESARMDIYMAHRELREEFEEIEAGSGERSLKC